MHRVGLFLAVLFLGGLALSDPEKRDDDDVLHYRRNNEWRSTKVSKLPLPFQSESQWGGVYVEIHLGSAGMDRREAILVSYAKVKNSRAGIIAYNEAKDIALLGWDRWNRAALNLTMPDANDVLAGYGFKCSALDVIRLLRLTDEAQ